MSRPGAGRLVDESCGSIGAKRGGLDLRTPPFRKGGRGGFCRTGVVGKSPCVPLFQRGSLLGLIPSVVAGAEAGVLEAGVLDPGGLTSARDGADYDDGI
jgi:hypothetical protein